MLLRVFAADGVCYIRLRGRSFSRKLLGKKFPNGCIRKRGWEIFVRARVRLPARCDKIHSRTWMIGGGNHRGGDFYGGLALLLAVFNVYRNCTLRGFLSVFIARIFFVVPRFTVVCCILEMLLETNSISAIRMYYIFCKMLEISNCRLQPCCKRTLHVKAFIVCETCIFNLIQ